MGGIATDLVHLDEIRASTQRALTYEGAGISWLLSSMVRLSTVDEINRNEDPEQVFSNATYAVQAE